MLRHLSLPFTSTADIFKYSGLKVKIFETIN